MLRTGLRWLLGTNRDRPFVRSGRGVLTDLGPVTGAKVSNAMCDLKRAAYPSGARERICPVIRKTPRPLGVLDFDWAGFAEILGLIAVLIKRWLAAEANTRTLGAEVGETGSVVALAILW